MKEEIYHLVAGSLQGQVFQRGCRQRREEGGGGGLVGRRRVWWWQRRGGGGYGRTIGVSRGGAKSWFVKYGHSVFIFLWYGQARDTTQSNSHSQIDTIFSREKDRDTQ